MSTIDNHKKKELRDQLKQEKICIVKLNLISQYTKEAHKFTNRVKIKLITLPSAVLADKATFRPRRLTFFCNLIAWLLGFGPWQAAPCLNCQV
jgi:hypothetical protein